MEYESVITWHEGGSLHWSRRHAWTSDDESAISIFQDQATRMQENRKLDAQVFYVRKGKRTVFNG